MSKPVSNSFKGTNGEKSALIQELENNGIKFSKKDMVFITRDSSGQVVWLETGNNSSGLKHIVNRHADDFLSKHGVSSSDIESHLNKIFATGNVEYMRITSRSGKNGYEKMYSYNGNYYLLTGVGTNGYIVSGYPVDVSTATKLIRRYKK